MNWPPNKAWTSTTSRLGFRHFVAINYGGKGVDRWVHLVSVLDGTARLRVPWKEMKDLSQWSSGWQKLPKSEVSPANSKLISQLANDPLSNACLHPSEDLQIRPWFSDENN